MKILRLLLLLLLSSCSLNADQEASLNNSLSSYINSRNNGAVMSYVAFTHPTAVAFYKTQGDSIFKKRYDLSDEENQMFLQDGNIREIVKKDRVLHVHYNFLCILDDLDSQLTRDESIFAVSEDNGVTWFFLNEEDYMNNQIIKPSKRLIEK